MSNKKEITIDVGLFGANLCGFKFHAEQCEYMVDFHGRPTVRMQVIGVPDLDRGLPPRDVLHAEFEKTLDAAKNGDGSAMKRLMPLAEACVRADKAPVMSPLGQKVIEAMMEGRAVHGDGFQVRIDTALANNALKSAAEAHAKATSGALHDLSIGIVGSALCEKRRKAAEEPLKTSVPEGVSIHHDLERRFTIAYRISANGRLAFVGIAYCSPQDQFCRRTGRELAISRLEERPCRVVKLPRVMAPGTDDYPKNGAEWRAVEQSILLGLGLLR